MYGKFSKKTKALCFWGAFLTISLLLLFKNDFGNSILHIGSLDLSVVSDVVICLFLIAVAYFATTLIAHVTKKNWRQYVVGALHPWPKTADGIRTIVTTDEGVSITTPVSTHFYRWCVISDIEDIGEFLFILSGSSLIATIPHRSFLSKQEFSEFIEEIIKRTQCEETSVSTSRK